ncbi:hypothetical protein JVU11DRAFT_6616 [Chiua virens]|nr:hypothetical protein JVU11DRAFT_6616 [Chiua virens]
MLSKTRLRIQAVGLEERRKHANTKAKKLKKTLEEDEQAAAECMIEESTAKIARKRAEIEEHEAQLRKEEDVLENIRDSLKEFNSLKATKANLQKELQAHEKNFHVRARNLHDTPSLTRDRSCLQAAQAQVQELRGKSSSLRQRTEEAKASQAASTSQNKVLDSLTRLKQTGRIDGFHARTFCTLGTIPDKYDVAISTACGALHNMVVDTVAQGQACIDFGRKTSVALPSWSSRSFPPIAFTNVSRRPKMSRGYMTSSSLKIPSSYLRFTRLLGTRSSQTI